MTTQMTTTQSTSVTTGTGTLLIEGQARQMEAERTVTVDRDGGNRSGWHLEQIRDDLLRRKTIVRAADHERSPSQMMVRFGSNGRPAQAGLMVPRGGEVQVEPMTFSRRGLQQLAQRILPARGLGFLEHLAIGGSEDRKERDVQLATMAWSTFAMRHTSPVLFRTEKLGDERVIRASLSQGYVTYDHHQYLTDVLDALGPDSNLYRVADYRVDDGALRLRLIGGSEEDLSVWRNKEVNKPMPTVQLYNGEYGNSAVYVRSGTFTLWCSNGCGHWGKDRAEWRWNHSGSAQRRIREGVKGAITEARIQSSGIVDAYEKALDTAVDDAWAWFQSETEGVFTGVQQEAVRTAMLNEPTVQSNAGLLAQVIDATTWVAQDQSFEEQLRMERMAGVLLQRGLQNAQGGRLTAPLPLS